MRWRRAVLKRSCPEQEVDDVSLVRLQPVELQRLHFADVEAIDICGIEELSRKRFIFGNTRPDQCVANFTDHFVLRAFDDGTEWKHEFRIGHRVVSVGNVQNCRPKEVTSLIFNKPVTITVLGCGFGHSSRLAAIVDLTIHRFCRARRRLGR